MKISKNKTHHEKVYDLTSPTIPHFQLSLKTHKVMIISKKVPKGVTFFLSTTVDVFLKMLLYFPIKTTTLRILKCPKKFFFENFDKS